MQINERSRNRRAVWNGGRRLLGLVTSLAFAVAASASFSESDVRRTVLEFAERWTNADEPEEISAFYAEDATHVNPQGEWVRSREELTGYFQPLVDGRSDGFSAEFDIERIWFASDGVALVDGSITIRGMRRADGTVSPELFERFSFVMTKSDERWEIAASRVMFPAGR